MESSPKAAVDESFKARLRDFAGALRNAPRAFALLWEADCWGTGGMGAVAILSAFVPVSQAWVTKLIVDGVLRALKQGLSAGQGLKSVLPYLLCEFALVFAGSALGQAKSLIDQLLDHRLGHLVNVRIIRKALGLEARFFEDPDFYDKMQRARRQSEYRAMATVRSVFSAAQNALTLLSFAAVLLSFNPWIAAVLFATALPALAVQSRYSRLTFRLQTWRTPETRSLSYLEQLLTVDTAVKEVKLFALGEPLLKRYRDIFRKIFDEDSKVARERSVKSLLWGLLGILSYYGAYAWIIALTVLGRITLGGMTLYLAVFRQSQGAFTGLLWEIGQLYENGLFLDNLFGFLGLESSLPMLDASKRPAEDPRRGIEFKNVSFRYPGGAEWALRDFSLEIFPGEKLALVGENGAGKTTLIKLLTRLYEPASGAILFRGVDLRYFAPAELHARIGAIFQDYVRYHLSLRENIGFGAIERLADEERILSAARKSGADEIARSLPRQYDTRLGRWFEEGQELSGGEWQKVALGRAFMREGEVLVLDEPTAALDAAAEHEVFERFKRLTAGRIAILISHRFSTVRMADRIAVLRRGELLELGTHDELLARDGLYARLFELQARGYR